MMGMAFFSLRHSNLGLVVWAGHGPPRESEQRIRVLKS